jgi:WD40 repeat protein
VAFSPDGQILASGGSDSRVKVWDMTPGGHEHLKASLRAHTGGEVISLAWSPDGNTIASGGEDSSVRVWGRFVWHRRPDDKDLHAPPVTLTGHESHVTGLAWAGNGVLLASCGKDNIVKVHHFSRTS